MTLTTFPPVAGLAMSLTPVLAETVVQILSSLVSASAPLWSDPVAVKLVETVRSKSTIAAAADALAAALVADVAALLADVAAALALLAAFVALVPAVVA